MTETFGARFASLDSIEERLALERSEERRAPYVLVDRTLNDMISWAMRGERIAKRIKPPKKRQPDSVQVLLSMSDEARAAVADHFEVEQQERRGGWYVPGDEKLSLGLIHAVHWMRRNPRLALSLAEAEYANPQFRGAPEAVAVWVLEPLFEQLMLPVQLRGWYQRASKTVEKLEKQWEVIDPIYSALGLDLAPLDRFRIGRGWAGHSSETVVELRRALLETWASAPADVADRYRAYRIGQLVDAYYAKAKNGKALRRRVLTKPLGRTLTAYFGGDWLAFLRFIDEEPHPNEEIIQALPETKLVVGTSSRTEEVASKQGLPAAEVQQILAAYWQQADHTSPIEQRVNVLKRYWSEFDAIHARQAPGMPSLWGLVQAHGEKTALIEPRGTDDYQPGLHEKLFSAGLNADVERLWGTSLLPRWPERLVTELEPHACAAEALGPTLRFWEGAALTAWFVCEGPYSRTDLPGLAAYHEYEVEALANAGCPVPDGLFQELREAEAQLGPEVYDDEDEDEDPDESSEIDVGNGITMTLSVSMRMGGSGRREGFEMLRGIITRYRRWWAEQYLDAYLRTQWEADLRTAGELYHRHGADKGKPPTFKQFAKMAEAPARQWFAGNLNGVYGVLGLKAPAEAERAPRLVPEDIASLAAEVYRQLSGERYKKPPPWNEGPELRQRVHNLRSLAEQAVVYLQLQEALGRPPTITEFGRSKFSNRAEPLGADEDAAWDAYAQAIALATESPGSKAAAASTEVVEAQQQAQEVPADVAWGGSVTAAVQQEGTADNGQASVPPGWHPDPYGVHQWRWWDGQQWTEHVSG